MARPNPHATIAGGVVALALRQRQKRLLWIGVAVLVLGASAVLSHLRHPADPARWDGQTVTVERVIDGNTIIVSGPALNHEPMRLCGVDAPEVQHAGLDTDEHFGPEARRYLDARLTGKAITLKFEGTEKRDPDQRLLGYVYLGDSDCVNVDLVRDGMAYADRRVKSMLESTLDQVEQQARSRKIGLWASVKETDMPAWRQAWLRKFKSRNRE